jgi:hypothetical protein
MDSPGIREEEKGQFRQERKFKEKTLERGS